MNIEPLEARIAPATFVVNVLTDVVADDGELTLREAIAAANDTPAADMIKFDPSLAGTITLVVGTFNITETLTIMGGGKITLSGNTAVRIFSVNNADTVKDHPLTVSGLRFIGGNAGASNDGGAINSSEGLTIVDCIFADNTAGGDGGAVRVSTTTGALTVKNSHFADNTSTDGFGGGLFAVAGKGVTVTGSVFAGNVGDSFGGAFLSMETGTAKVAITGSTFSENDATFSGGGLGASGRKVSITNSQFIGNTADVGGGGLSLGGGGFTLTGLKFLGNSAATGGAISSAQGAETIMLSKSLLEGNEATGSAGGGGIYLTGAVSGFAATISATQIIGNEATAGSGGGIRVLDTGGKITISGSLISGNTASSAGGGVAVHQNDSADPIIVTLTGNTISGNNADSAAGVSLFRHGDFILSKNVISGNRANNGVGGVSFDVDGDVTFKLNQVVGNQGRIGGMDFVAGTGSTFTNSGNVIAHNEGTETGGLSILSAVDITIAKNTKITGNIAGNATRGGGITESGSGVITLLAPVLGNYNRVNAAADQTQGTFAGAPVPLPSVAATFTVTTLADSGPGSLRDAIAQANATPAADKIKFADTLAGVITFASEIDITEAITIYGRGKITLSGNNTTRIFDIASPDNSKDHPVTLSGLVFAKGNAPGAAGDGGAIRSFEGLAILDSTFVDNAAGRDGGAVYVSTEIAAATTTIKNTHFVDNTAGSLGGGLRAFSEKSIFVAGSVFSSNVGDNAGGASLGVATFLTAKIGVTGSLFIGNAAQDGGGGGITVVGEIGPDKATKMSISGSSFLGNTASGSGGGLRLARGDLALTGVNFVGNTAGDEGGGVAVRTLGVKVFTVAKSLIAKNVTTSVLGGGGVYFDEGDSGFAASFTSTQILGNTAASGIGGGLFADGVAGKLTVTSSLVADNSAATGGGLATRGTGIAATAVVLTGNVIAGNTAGSGAGLSLSGDGALALTKNAIVANEASLGGGGAILQSIATITLKTNSVLANRAESGVGGLFLAGPASASFTTAGDVIAFNEGSTTGGLQLGAAISGIIAKNTKITANIGAGAIYGGGVTQDSSGTVKLLATILGNLNLTTPARNEVFGLFAP